MTGLLSDNLRYLDERGEIIHLSSDGLSQVIRAAGDCIKLVVLNACYTKIQAEALVAHVPCVIGMPHAIGDHAAIVYAANFYCALAFGRSVANAHQCGLAALAVDSSADSGVDEARDLAAAEAALRRAVPEMLTRQGVDARQIHIVRGASTVDSMSQAPADARVHVELTFDADLETFSDDALARTIGEVRRLTGARSVKIICVTKGSVKVTLSLDGAAAARLRELRQGGQLDQMGGLAIKDVTSFEPIESYVEVRLAQAKSGEDEDRTVEVPLFDVTPSPRLARDDAGPGQFSALDDMPLSRRVGRFTLRKQVGRGGQAHVYEAYDEELDRRVALKLCHTGDADRQLRTARALARMSHPNVAQLYEVGIHAGRPFLAMEFVAGVTLSRWLEDEAASLPPPRRQQVILRRFIAAGRALQAAHAAGVVHGDFKPSNVMVRDDGQVRVVDFGLAHHFASSTPEPFRRMMLGTPRYMAPEQWNGELLDPRTDQFSFCVALYQALTDVNPFPAPPANPYDAIKAGPARIRDSARVPRRLEHALRRGLSFLPSQRFASMGELLEEIESFARPRRGATSSLVASLAALTGLAALWMGLASVAATDSLRWVLIVGLVLAAAAGGYFFASHRFREPDKAPDQR